MNNLTKEGARALIRKNIAEHGHHIYVVEEGDSPRFAYTIGLHQKIGVELILAGASFFTTNEVVRIINDIADGARTNPNRREFGGTSAQFGVFTLGEVDQSWVKLLLLGAIDFFQVDTVPALQIIPDKGHMTIDVPAMSRPWDATTEPVWRWLKTEWAYPIPSESVAVTNLAALRGERITEAARWEENEWELFAGPGPDVPEAEVRTVPIATLLAVDNSLLKVVSLKIGSALWRNQTDVEWYDWNSSAADSPTPLDR